MYAEGNGLGLNTPRWSFSIDGLHGLQKEVNETMYIPFPILQQAGKEAAVLGYLFIVLRSQKELKRNSSVVN